MNEKTQSAVESIKHFLSEKTSGVFESSKNDKLFMFKEIYEIGSSSKELETYIYNDEYSSFLFFDLFITKCDDHYRDALAAFCCNPKILRLISPCYFYFKDDDLNLRLGLDYKHCGISTSRIEDSVKLLEKAIKDIYATLVKIANGKLITESDYAKILIFNAERDVEEILEDASREDSEAKKHTENTEDYDEDDDLDDEKIASTFKTLEPPPFIIDMQKRIREMEEMEKRTELRDELFDKLEYLTNQEV